jgi:hypothetical protein
MESKLQEVTEDPSIGNASIDHDRVDTLSTRQTTLLNRWRPGPAHHFST